jgi:hypothetical protein
MCLKINFKILFYEVFFHVSKELFENPNFYFCIMQESSFARIYKVLSKILFYFENLFLTVPL